MKEPKKNNYPDPPGHLSTRAKELWQQYAGPVLRSPGQLALFETGLAALDRADKAREIITQEGMTLTTDKAKIAHQHPAFLILKESENTLLKVWKALNLNWPGKWQKNNLPELADL